MTEKKDEYSLAPFALRTAQISEDITVPIDADLGQITEHSPNSRNVGL